MENKQRRGRPKSAAISKHINARISESVYCQLIAISKATNRSLSNVVSTILLDHLKENNTK